MLLLWGGFLLKHLERQQESFSLSIPPSSDRKIAVIQRLSLQAIVSWLLPVRKIHSKESGLQF